MRSFGKAIAACALLATLGSISPLRAQESHAAELYKQAMVRDAALREELDAAKPGQDRAALLRRVRALTSAYDDMSRLFPKSGYSDNALWQGATLSADAFWAFGDATDRATALRLLRALVARFPTSSLVKEVAPLQNRLEAAKPTSITAAVSPITPGPRAAATTPAPPQATARAASAARPAPAATAGSQPANARATSTPSTRAIAATPAAVLLKSVRREVLPEAVRVTLELEREAAFRDQRPANTSRVFIDLVQTVPAEGLAGATLAFTDDVVRGVRVNRQQGAVITRVALDVQGAPRYSVYSLYNPYRVVIDFERDPAPRPAAPTPPKDTRNAAAVPPKPAAPAAPAPARVTRPRPVVARVLPSRALAAWTAFPPVADRTPVTAVAEAATALGAPPRTAATRRPASPSGKPVIDAAAAAPPAAALAPTIPSANTNGGFSLSRQLGLGVARIVIDAGHGGRDPGAKGKNLTEAQLVLDVALKLEKLLAKQPGVEVVLTRRSDVFVPLEERTAIANRADADLFLSIHANASGNPSARGVETYFLNFAPTPEAEAIAARENAASERTMRNLPDIVRAIALNNKIDESRDFATAVQGALFERLRKANRELRNLGVKQAPFVVLIGATMPSVLAEISFLTNGEEGTLLRTDKYRQQIADALFAGIMRYQQALKRAPIVAAQ